MPPHRPRGAGREDSRDCSSDAPGNCDEQAPNACPTRGRGRQSLACVRLHTGRACGSAGRPGTCSLLLSMQPAVWPSSVPVSARALLDLVQAESDALLLGARETAALLPDAVVTGLAEPHVGSGRLPGSVANQSAKARQLRFRYALCEESRFDDRVVLWHGRQCVARRSLLRAILDDVPGSVSTIANRAFSAMRCSTSGSSWWSRSRSELAMRARTRTRVW
jgi:hypothetical protein